ncbi:pentapeptide repeat-containing protein [Amycolatopsis lurida]
MWNWLTWDLARWIGGGLLVLAALALTRVRSQFLPRLPWSLGWRVSWVFDRVLPGGVVRMIVGWLALALVVAGGVMTGLLWLLGWPSLPSGAAFGASQLLELLKIALAVVAGLGGVVLLAVNLRKQRVAEQEHDLAVERGEREKTQAFNERFGAAAEQLAHASSAVRLAGVYAMAGLADDWRAQQQVCVDVLCGYLRLSTEPDAPGEREVRAAILQVIREHTRPNRLRHWSHSNFDLSGVVFENADFSGLDFRGALVLDRADFTGALCSFEGTTFSGTLSCHGTDFLAERTTFANADFDRARAEFVGARFAGVADFSRIDLSSIAIDFYRVDFSSAKVDFSLAIVRGGTLRFDRCDFVSADLDLSGANVLLDEDEVTSGRIAVQRCRFEESTVDLRDGGRSPLLFWFVGSRFDRVEFSRGWAATGWLNLRDCELAGGTEIPDSWLRVPHTSSR